VSEKSDNINYRVAKRKERILTPEYKKVASMVVNCVKTHKSKLCLVLMMIDNLIQTFMDY